ncbi:MAG: hypothetical protein R3E32_19705 [Chitinophagales bacterium]
MTNPNFAVFRVFPNVEQAEEMAEVLKNNGLAYKIIDNSPSFNPSFSLSTLENEVQLLLLASDFDQANEFLEKDAEMLVEDLDKDYYLFVFSNEELYEILAKPDEWNTFDYKLAQKILIQRGENVGSNFIEELKERRLQELAQPEDGEKHLIVGGYILAFGGGVIGLCIGWYLWKDKKILPNGQKVYHFSENHRKHGYKIFILGIIFFIVSLVSIIIREM